MAKIALHQGSYLARSPIANAQSCINLYAEPNPQDAPFPVTHYPAPGLYLLSDFTGLLNGYVRGLYMASDGSVYAVIGTSVIRWIGPGNTAGSYYLMGDLGENNGVPISMCDNGATLVVVDGSSNGWTSPLPGAPGSLTQINDSAFYGSLQVDYIDTFLVFTIPGTGTFYTTTSGVVTPFDPTYAAAKEGWNDKLVTTRCLHDNIWLLGNQTTEIWYNAGGTTFPFARMPNSILQQGCVSGSSVVIADNAIYWLSQDRYGRNMMMRGEGYQAKRISNFAVESEWALYPTLVDAVGMAYQIMGHENVCWYFPSGQAWWAYDASTQMWHKRTYGDTTTPWLPFCMTGWGSTAFINIANGVIVGDRRSPILYDLAPNTYTDNGVPIQRQRSWPHMQQDGNRVHHSRFSADMAGAPLQPDTVQLSWSDDGGETFGTPVPQTINNATNGQYQWRRLGYARDRVYQLNWSGNGEFALNGAYVDIAPQGT